MLIRTKAGKIINLPLNQNFSVDKYKSPNTDGKFDITIHCNSASYHLKAELDEIEANLFLTNFLNYLVDKQPLLELY